MKQSYLKFSIFIILFLLVSIPLFAQNNQQFWSKTTKEQSKLAKQVLRKTEPEKALFFKLDVTKLKSSLKSVSAKTNASNTVAFPNSEGVLETFQVSETSI